MQNESRGVFKIETIEKAQLEMRNNYLYGATGIIVSGIVWLLSGVVAYSYSPEAAVWTLLIGGIFIHPVSIVLIKILGATGNHSKSNPLGSLAMEGTFFMLMTIPLAYGLSLQRFEWFFDGMLLIIGGRYLTFNTIYGSRLFWILGALLGITAYTLFSLNAPSHISAFTGASIEILFGSFVLMNSRRAKGREEKR
jgi:hypothetical protein